MSTFIAAQHPRSRSGEFTKAMNSAPTGRLDLVDEEPDWEAQDDPDFIERGEQWAAEVAAGRATEPDHTVGSAAAWDSDDAPF